MYAMSIIATIGWFLFMIFGAIGLVALPLDWIRQFIGRPRKTITRSQYIERARDLARRAKDVRAIAEVLKREEREGAKGRRWRKNFKALQNQMVLLEEDEQQLELVFPQASAAALLHAGGAHGCMVSSWLLGQRDARQLLLASQAGEVSAC